MLQFAVRKDAEMHWYAIVSSDHSEAVSEAGPFTSRSQAQTMEACTHRAHTHAAFEYRIRTTRSRPRRIGN